MNRPIKYSTAIAIQKAKIRSAQTKLNKHHTPKKYNPMGWLVSLITTRKET